MSDLRCHQVVRTEALGSTAAIWWCQSNGMQCHGTGMLLFLEAEDTGDRQSPGPVLIIFGVAYVIIILNLPPKFEASCV
jgi:hypothetical protein